MWDEHNTRNPMLLLRLFGLFLLRLAERALSWLLFQDPPRSTRPQVNGRPHRRNDGGVDYAGTKRP